MSPSALFFKDLAVPAMFGFLLPFLFACNTCLAEDGIRRHGDLPPCPSTPNCVSSRAEKAKQRVDPILFHGDPASAWSRLRTVVSLMKGALIAEEKAGYLRAEFRSAVFGFVDDLEMLLDEAAKRIDVRSASRTGYFDFGVNRGRVEEIRDRFGREP